MADLEYTISTKGELAGAQALSGHLQAQIGAAKALKQDFSALQSQLDQVNGAMKSAKVPVEDLADSEENLTGNKRELLHQLKELKHELPGVGELMHLVKNPAIALGIAVAWTIGKFKEFSAQVEEAAKAVEPFEAITASFGRFRSVAAEGKAEAAEFARTLHKISEEADTAETRFNQLNAALEFQAKLEDDLRQKRLALAKAQVDLNEAEGKISPIEAGRRKQLLDEGAAGSDSAAKSRVAAAQYAARIVEIRQTQNAKAQAEEGLPTLLGNTEQARRAAAATGKLADETIRYAADALARIKDRKKLFEEEQALSPLSRHYLASQIEAGLIAAEDDLAANIHQTDSAQALKVQSAAKLKAATDAETEAKAKIAEYAKQLEKLEADRLAQQQQINAAQAAGRQGTALEAATGRTATTAHELQERKKALEEYHRENEEIRTRRERGEDDRDLLRKRAETERTLRDTGGIPLSEATAAMRELPALTQAILDATNAIRAQVQNLS